MKAHAKIVPLSINKAWKGKRYSTDEYKSYRLLLTLLLPKKIILPEPFYEIKFVFGLSSTLSDWDNPIKPAQDIIAKKYGFNDKLIRKGSAEIVIVDKGFEFLEFDILHLSK
jgi:hypothetical protein